MTEYWTMKVEGKKLVFPSPFGVKVVYDADGGELVLQDKAIEFPSPFGVKVVYDFVPFVPHPFD